MPIVRRLGFVPVGTILILLQVQVAIVSATHIPNTHTDATAIAGSSNVANGSIDTPTTRLLLPAVAEKVNNGGGEDCVAINATLGKVVGEVHWASKYNPTYRFVVTNHKAGTILSACVCRTLKEWGKNCTVPSIHTSGQVGNERTTIPTFVCLATIHPSIVCLYHFFLSFFLYLFIFHSPSILCLSVLICRVRMQRMVHVCMSCHAMPCHVCSTRVSGLCDRQCQQAPLSSLPSFLPLKSKPTNSQQHACSLDYDCHLEYNRRCNTSIHP